MIPGLKDIFDDNAKRLPKFATLGDLVSGFINIAFYGAAFLTFYFLVWGAFAYITARGDKEGLAKARARITWAIIGFMVILLAFLIAKYFSEIFPPKGGVPF